MPKISTSSHQTSYKPSQVDKRANTDVRLQSYFNNQKQLQMQKSNKGFLPSPRPEKESNFNIQGKTKCRTSSKNFPIRHKQASRPHSNKKDRNMKKERIRSIKHLKVRLKPNLPKIQSTRFYDLIKKVRKDITKYNKLKRVSNKSKAYVPNRKRKATKKSKASSKSNTHKTSCLDHVYDSPSKKDLKRQRKDSLNRKEDQHKQQIKKPNTGVFETNIKKTLRKKQWGESEQMEDLINYFHKSTALGPIHICICCDRLCYKHAVVKASKALNDVRELVKECTKGPASAEGIKWLCHNCNHKLKKGEMPPMAMANGLQFPTKPSFLELHQLEWRLLAPRLVFMKIFQAPRGRQFKLQGNVINVIANVANTVSKLPRKQSNTDTIPVKLKRKEVYTNSTMSQNVRPNKVFQAAKWLSLNGPLYKKEGISFTSTWAKHKRVSQWINKKAKALIKRSAKILSKHRSLQTKRSSETHYWCDFQNCYYITDNIQSASHHLKTNHKAYVNSSSTGNGSTQKEAIIYKQNSQKAAIKEKVWCTLCSRRIAHKQKIMTHMMQHHELLSKQKALQFHSKRTGTIYAYKIVRSKHIRRLRLASSNAPKTLLSIINIVKNQAKLTKSKARALPHGKLTQTDNPQNNTFHNQGFSKTVANNKSSKYGVPQHETSESESEDESNVTGNTDTMLSQKSYIESSEFGGIHDFAPGEGNKPQSIFLDKFCEEMAYPDIFLGHERQETSKVPTSYSDIVKSELMRSDRRAATNVENIFFKTKKIQMKLLTSRTQIALRQHVTNNLTLTAQDIKDSTNIKKIIQFDQGYKFLATLRGSPPYFEKAKKDIFAMLRQLGPATFFVSLSAAETKWKHLIRILGQTIDKVSYTDEEIDKMSWPEISRLIQGDPISCARHFDHSLQLFITQFLKNKISPIGEILDYFYRIEMQHRGSCHVHMLIWIKHAPLFEKNSLNDIIEFIDKYTTCAEPSINEPTLKDMVDRQKHTHSPTCRTKKNVKCRFGYPQPPMPSTVILEPLVNTDEIYNTHAETWKKIKHFLEETNHQSNLVFDKFLAELNLSYDDYILGVRSSIKSRTIFLKREIHEININNYNKDCLKAWRANMDIQYIIDSYACATYIVSYMSKGSRGISTLLRQACKEANAGNNTLKEKMRCIGNKFLNAVEISAQEAAYIALQLALRKSSRMTVFINTSPPNERVRVLKSCEEINELADDDTDIDSSNLLKRYSKRNASLETTTLAEWAAWYDCRPSKKKVIKTPSIQKDGTPAEPLQNFESDNVDDLPLKMPIEKDVPHKKRTQARIIRCPWFSYSQNPEKHYRELVMLFVPWRNETADLYGGFHSYQNHYTAKRDSILKLLEVYSPGRAAVEEAISISHEIELENLENYAVAHNAQHANDKDIAQPNENVNDPTFVQHYDIGIDMGIFDKEMPRLEELQHNEMADQEFRAAIQRLNAEQRTIADFITESVQTSEKQLMIFLSGGGGVGKTLTTKAIYQQLLKIYNRDAGDDFESLKVLVMAPTGKAAHLIQGSTIHSALSAQFNRITRDYKPLSASKLNSLRVKLCAVKFIIIDEISMVGRNLFTFIDKRMQDISGTTKPFGGCHVLCVGDLFQLQPVADSWIFKDNTEGLNSFVRSIWHENFQLYEQTQIMRQKDHVKFAEMLNRLREGKHNISDKKYLLTKVTRENFKNSNYSHRKITHLFNKNSEVDEFNENARTDRPVNINAKDEITGACSKEIIDGHLKKLKSKPARETMGLASQLKVALKDKIEICINIDISDGLTNGASGTITGLPGTDSSGNSEAVGYIWIHFDDARIGRQTRRKFRNLYTNHTPKHWTPIYPVKKQIEISSKTSVYALRIQFPIRCAAAKTIHRSQGQTLQAVVADFKTAYGPHKHYVAISRVSDPNQLFITNLDLEKIQIDKRVSNEMNRLRTEAQLQIPEHLRHNIKMDNPYATFFNIRSLNKYCNDLASEFTIKNSLITCLTETHLREDNNIAQLLKSHPHQTHLMPNKSYQNGKVHHGISILSKTKLSNITHHVTRTYEAIAADINFSKDITIVCLYRYNKTPVNEFIEDLTKLLSSCTKCSGTYAYLFSMCVYYDKYGYTSTLWQCYCISMHNLVFVVIWCVRLLHAIRYLLAGALIR